MSLENLLSEVNHTQKDKFLVSKPDYIELYFYLFPGCSVFYRKALKR
jgi:hypothetical protein